MGFSSIFSVKEARYLLQNRIIGVAIHILFSSLIQLLISLKSLEIQTASHGCLGALGEEQKFKTPLFLACGFLMLPYFYKKNKYPDF